MSTNSFDIFDSLFTKKLQNKFSGCLCEIYKFWKSSSISLFRLSDSRDSKSSSESRMWSWKLLRKLAMNA